MNFLAMYGKDEWYSIFLASVIFVLFFGLALISKWILWFFFGFSVLGLFVSIYFSFFHKFPQENKEFDEMLDSMKDMFKGK